MNREYANDVQIEVLAVFRRGTSGGNALGLASASGLDGARMQRIAAQLGFSETVFVGGDHSRPQVRIFTPSVELPFAGHPIVGAAWALRRLETPPATIRCGAGEVDLVTDGDLCGFTVGWPELGAVRPAADSDVAAAGMASAPAWWVERPGDVLVVMMPHRRALDICPTSAAIAAAADGVYQVYEDGDRATVRFYAPRLGVPEDPATGSAAAALANVHRHLGQTTGRLTIDQGDYVGSPSRIVVSWAEEGVTVLGSVAVTGIVDV